MKKAFVEVFILFFLMTFFLLACLPRHFHPILRRLLSVYLEYLVDKSTLQAFWSTHLLIH